MFYVCKMLLCHVALCFFQRFGEIGEFLRCMMHLGGREGVREPEEFMVAIMMVSGIIVTITNTTTINAATTTIIINTFVC